MISGRGAAPLSYVTVCPVVPSMLSWNSGIRANGLDAVRALANSSLWPAVMLAP